MVVLQLEIRRLLIAATLLHTDHASALVKQEQVKTITITAAPSIPSQVPEFLSDDRFTSAILNSTNFFRGEHNATAVTYNATLARFATDFLEHGDGDCDFHHSGGPYGENIAIGYSDAASSVDAWGNERDKYDFSDPGFDHDTGHFTQLVWKNTTDVGCGRKLCGTRGWFLVCEYFPRGNIIGQFRSQVQAIVNGTSGSSVAALIPVAGSRVVALFWLGMVTLLGFGM